MACLTEVFTNNITSPNKPYYLDFVVSLLQIWNPTFRSHPNLLSGVHDNKQQDSNTQLEEGYIHISLICQEERWQEHLCKMQIGSVRDNKKRKCQTSCNTHCDSATTRKLMDIHPTEDEPSEMSAGRLRQVCLSSSLKLLWIYMTQRKNP